MSQTLPTVLCVDDEANVLDGLKRQLRRDADVTPAASGADALTAIRRTGPFAVILTDYNMPSMNGVEFLREARDLSPDTVTIMLTGQSDLGTAISALHEGHIFRFLQKPCPPDVLRKAVRDAVQQYRLITSEKRLSRELAEANDKLRGINEHLEQMVSQRTATIQRLHRFVTDLNGLETLADVGRLVVETTVEMLNSRRVVLMVPRNGREYLGILAAVGVCEQTIETARLPIGQGINGRVFADGESLVANQAVDLLDPQDEELEREFFAGVPLVAALLVTSAGPVGVLGVSGHDDGRPYEAEDLANLRAIAEGAGIALSNQIRLEERNEARDAINLAFAKLAERRDPETGLHLERVRGYCRILGTALAGKPGFSSITRSFIESMWRLSPLHDIGKVGIPDHILQKPGKLTAEEFEIMKRHSVIGGDTIRAVIEQGRSQDFLQMAMEIAYYHHEKYDGSGYPYGLRGDAIPLCARIMAVADVYDALTSRRVYKPPFPHEKACQIIYEGAGKHFDPTLVEVFREREQEFADLARHLADVLPDDKEPSAAIPAGPQKVESLAVI
ncbi:MAG: response regulator [Planctomycetes bacterium]|nr:response regulator [Planctomycetota bacterium]